MTQALSNPQMRTNRVQKWLLFATVAVLLLIVVRYRTTHPQNVEDHPSVVVSAGEPGTVQQPPRIPASAGQTTAPAQIPVQSKAVHEASIKYVDRVFMPVLPVFHLTPDQNEQLKQWLIEWSDTRADTQAVLQDTNLALHPRTDAVKQNLADVETQMAALVGPELFPEIKAMLDASGDLARVANAYAPALQKMGYPLSPEQRMGLSVVLHQTFDSRINPTAADRGKLPVNESTGLTALDETALERLSKVLTPPQLALVRNSLAETNKVTAPRRD